MAIITYTPQGALGHDRWTTDVCSVFIHSDCPSSFSLPPLHFPLSSYPPPPPPPPCRGWRWHKLWMRRECRRLSHPGRWSRDGTGLRPSSETQTPERSSWAWASPRTEREFRIVLISPTCFVGGHNRCLECHVQFLFLFLCIMLKVTYLCSLLDCLRLANFGNMHSHESNLGLNKQAHCRTTTHGVLYQQASNQQQVQSMNELPIDDFQVACKDNNR